MPELPDELLHDLSVLGLNGVTAARPLVGGRGGRTWRIDADHGSFVLHRRTPSQGRSSALLREQRSTALANAAGVGPQPVAHDEARGLLLTRWIPGRACSQARLSEPAVLIDVAHALRELHSATLPRHKVRPAQARRAYLDRATSSDDELVPVLQATRSVLDQLGDRLEASVPHLALVHGDVVPGNVILRSAGAALVDFEYAGRGDPAFDLGNLVASSLLDAAALRRLVRAYVDEGHGDRARWELRTKAWSRIAQGGWIAWVVAGEELGPHAAHWRRWARAAAADLAGAHRRGALSGLVRDLDQS
jgi:thiamine kinase-like enzyme